MERITSSKGGNCGARAFNTKSQRREDIFSELVNSKGMDLDNIDNIFRASSAMGLTSGECGEIAKMLASSFIVKDKKICLDGMYCDQIREWKRVRDLQYTAIFESIDDFSYQTMIKKAINLLLEEDEKQEKAAA